MTGPYQPPGGDINSPFGPSDPMSPYPSGAESQDGRVGNEDEASPYEGVQYELEIPGGQPQQSMAPPPVGPPGYGPTPPPPPAYGAPPPTYAPMPPKKTGGNGLLIGGVIAGVVVLLLLAGIVIVAVAANSSSDGPSGNPSGSEDEAFKNTYTVPAYPCTDVDLSSIETIAAFGEGSPSESSSPSETSGNATCYGSVGTIGETDYAYFSLTVDTYATKESVDYSYESNTGSTFMSGCEISEVSGSWEKGMLGTGTSCGSPSFGDSKAIIAIRDDNLSATVYYDCDSGVLSDAESAVQSVAESLITASKA